MGDLEMKKDHGTYDFRFDEKNNALKLLGRTTIM